jgi:hypothetical protein
MANPNYELNEHRAQDDIYKVNFLNIDLASLQTVQV